MATKKPATRQEKIQHFWDQPVSYLLSATLLWIVAYVMFSLAVDSGSILQWFITIFALIWGFVRFTQGFKKLLSLKYGKRRQTS